MKGVLYVVSGPSGVGKTSIIELTLKKVKNIVFSVSCTTRPKRPGEIDGKDYFFVSEPSFMKMVENGEFLEWAVVHSYYYGTLKKFVEEQLENGKNVLLDIDVQGAMTVMKKAGDAVYIFIAPPSFEELKQRLVKRGTEDKTNLERRLEDAKRELSFIPQFEYLIVNENLQESVDQLCSIIVAEQVRVKRALDRLGMHKFFENGGGYVE
ncbi:MULTISPECIES: guanylate kinase [Pseudothermotoga]|uniref:Guanylate kinase n=1 Tax=Pseudothermotoga lettingae (strain ATCC BAA-301 / DSM 14385 / NBRC 107922 / TMO) TaxID=416591 RepID=A8F7P8_PSELT|nr:MULTISPECIES: guanylate kinase [Pseudothermotoga]ABV34182.1 Guanylate kinase [Pseudothermotoga lettingae TMO]KUK21415.1 MAG: Guanylate kinase [Pseudothermotoga lettingae]MDI3495736.1 guanylate kinase [Pseudothermotoga sp.]MDK2884788.1 guanylate kinase [Pseudothermotoga sp.]GLI48874.1 guanylate kinase [Pseudothermotoga lettingae TMO]